MNLGFEEFPQIKSKLFMLMTVAIEMIRRVDSM